MDNKTETIHFKDPILVGTTEEIDIAGGELRGNQQKEQGEYKKPNLRWSMELGHTSSSLKKRQSLEEHGGAEIQVANHTGLPLEFKLIFRNGDVKGFVPPAKPFLLSAPPGGVSLNWKCISKSKVGGDAVIAAKGKKLGASMEVSTLVHKNTLEDGIVKFVEPLKAEKIRMVVFGVPPPGWDPERERVNVRKTQPNMAGLLALNYTVSTLSFFFVGVTISQFFFSTNREKMSRSPFNIPPEKHNLRFLILYQSTRFEQLLERRLFDGEDRVKMRISMTCLCQNPSDPVSRPNFILVKLRKHCTWHTQNETRMRSKPHWRV